MSLFIAINDICTSDIVYSPETVDKALIKCRRVENGWFTLQVCSLAVLALNGLSDVLGTVDFVTDDDKLCLRIHPDERDKLVVQLGTADPDLAVQAALLVYVALSSPLHGHAANGITEQAMSRG